MREVWVSGSKPSVLGRDSCLYLNTFMICLSPQIVGLEQRIRAAGSSQLALMVICSVAAGEPLRDLATISRSTKHGEGGGLREFKCEGKLEAAQVHHNFRVPCLGCTPSGSEIDGEKHSPMHTMRGECFVDAPLRDISYHVSREYLVASFWPDQQNSIR